MSYRLETLMPLSDVQIDKFVVLWKNATGADVSSEEAKQIAARLIHLYRILVHRIPSDRTPNAGGHHPGGSSAELTPESS